MARLNEAPQPAESVDSLKRRFIRQNRELAKTNSNQSVRIRSLENEQARILHENFVLHEEVIRLQSELERTRGDNAIRHVNAVKDKLDAKVQEISGLIAELNAIKNPARSSNPQPSQVTTDIFEWKRAIRAQAREEQVEDLPAIQEDKQYPRRTLNSEEIQAVIEGSAEDSPDLGPPPVAHFQEEDPIKFDPLPTADEPKHPNTEENELPIISTVNLEKRRRRRDSAKMDVRKLSVFQVPQEEVENKKSEDEEEASRAGTKRKLSFTTEDLQSEDANIDVREDFRVSRRGVSGRAEKSSGLSLDIKQNSKLDLLVAAERKALGDKTNTSPKKVMKSSSAVDKPDAKKPSALGKDASRSRVRDRRTKSSQVVHIAPPEPEEIVETKDVVVPEDAQPVEHHPKTPAGLDLFSPHFNEPSAEKRETKDTPPPTDLVPGDLESQQTSRPSRRARPQINYAEPNLVSKMRRPDKKLADAVADGRRSSSASNQETPAPSSSTAMRTVVIKKERESGGSGFKTLAAESQPEPASPLGDKMAAVHEIQSHNNAISAPEPAKSVQFEDRALAARESGSVSTSTTRKRTSKHHSDVEKDSRRDTQQVLAVFDIVQSSPEDHEKSNEEIMKSSRELAKKSRRHSTMTDMPTRTRDKEEPLSKSRGDQASDEGKKKAIRELRQGRTKTGETTEETLKSKDSSRRRSMMV